MYVTECSVAPNMTALHNVAKTTDAHFNLFDFRIKLDDINLCINWAHQQKLVLHH